MNRDALWMTRACADTLFGKWDQARTFQLKGASIWSDAASDPIGDFRDMYAWASGDGTTPRMAIATHALYEDLRVHPDIERAAQDCYPMDQHPKPVTGKVVEYAFGLEDTPFMVVHVVGDRPYTSNLSGEKLWIVKDNLEPMAMLTYISYNIDRIVGKPDA
jgi:hypothetical protein